MLSYDIYYMHNKEISGFLNKLKGIITSGLRRFISCKEIFLPSRFYFSNAIAACKVREHLHHVDVLFLGHIIGLLTTFRMQDLRLRRNIEIKTKLM